MNFERYIHLERFGNDGVQGIEFGECWIFPKLDGTNGSVWFDDGRICTGSRNRKLPEALSNQNLDDVPDDVRSNDNQGFGVYIGNNRSTFEKLLAEHPNRRLYGEWLVPHAFRGYRPEAWNRFYVFDVAQLDSEGNEHFIPFDIYGPWLEDSGIDYILPQCKIINPTYEKLLYELKQNHFLCEDGKGPGEGIVIKNYGYYNKHGQQVWAKLVSNEYKEQHTKYHGVSDKEFGQSVEEKIIDKFCTEDFIEKEYWKIVNDKGGWTSKQIPELFGRLFYTLVHEESWNILREFGQRITINYGALYALTVIKAKQVKKELF